MKLEELIQLVQEQHLDKDKLEDYRDQLSGLFAKMQLELAELEKKEALFPNENYPSAVARKTAWKATPAGQRLIELKRYCLAVKEMLSSLKSRLFNIY